jgi:hypothetical protein
MLAFEGSPIRKLAPELDAAKVEEHEKLLNDSQYKHLCAIRTCMKDLGHKLFEMTPKMFIEDVFDCCRFMLDSPEWGDYSFISGSQKGPGRRPWRLLLQSRCLRHGVDREFWTPISRIIGHSGVSGVQYSYNAVV